jgi:25S rRNA (adenine2142-N1)-methyltransferase
LNAQSNEILEQDFMEFKPQPFDIVCLSLVLNFVASPEDRGRMLLHARQFLNHGKLLYVVLPLPCLTNSRYMTHQHFIALMASIGFVVLEHHHATKIANYLFRLETTSLTPESSPQFARKSILNDGKTKNNFSIVIK